MVSYQLPLQKTPKCWSVSELRTSCPIRLTATVHHSCAILVPEKNAWNVCRKIKLKAYWLITVHYMCMNILVPYNQEDSLVSPSLALEPPLVFLNRLRSPQKDMFTARAGSTWCCGPGAPSLEPGVDHVGVQEMRDWTKNFYNGLSTVLNGFYQQSIGIIWLQYIVWIHV